MNIQNVQQQTVEDQSDSSRYGFEKLARSTIMMVDDEALTMAMVQSFLEEAGYRRFVLLEDSVRALAVLEDVRPDVLLLDLVMPEISGFDILTEIRRHPELRHLPVVVLTSSTDTETKLRALDLGATDFLAKPVDPSELALRVRNTLAVKAYQDRLAYYDPLTNFPNRRSFIDQLESTFSRSRISGERFAVLNIEVDQFEKIRDTQGIHIADEVLIGVAQSLERAVRDTDSLARLIDENDLRFEFSRFDGGAFALLVRSMTEVENAAVVAKRIREALKSPIRVADNEIFITVSIGIGVYPGNSDDCANLLREASSAKDYARGLGGDRFQFASAVISARYEKRLTIESKLRYAVQNGELLLHFQPQLDVETNRIVGFESLLRWRSPELGMVPPGNFIQLAEETGLIIPIGEWILEQACRTLKAWHERFDQKLSLAVNLSTKQFYERGFVDMVTRIIRDSRIDASRLTLELTESLLIDDVEHSILKLSALKSTGARLSIDDFGTGYSSLSYLQRLPVDELKVDRSFVASVTTSKSTRAITSSIIFLARSLGLTTVAEGVETDEQLVYLQSHECDVYQGYLFSPPVPEEESAGFFIADCG